ncbi:MAG TPA: folylpolyglutamate synthase/dihydrofolate synthase family protein [Saprospiraceae bacterium]|nr:folylpolyglutamate synthase/dihydrofolate synthase family protein [Saprospiraceae bacterium]
MMDYQQAEAYLFSQLPMYQRIGSKAWKPGLDNIRLLLDELGNPQEGLRMIHIAGTNGKGSVCHILSALLQQHGWRIGLYSSPHYQSYRERIKINSELIEEAVIADYVQRLKPLIEKHQFSFFEISVAMSLLYFKEQKVDLAIIETGMGGRLDSTNIISPIVCGITNIGMDHTDVLGDTLEQIAGEKAGIIKEFVPVVIGEKQKELSAVFKNYAKKQNAPLVYADQLAEAQVLDDGFVQVSLQGEEAVVDYGLKGAYQLNNLVTALAIYRVVCLELDEHLQSATSLKKALLEVRQLTGFMGRFQMMPGSPAVLLDSAHNPEGFESLSEDLKQMDYGRLHIVLGMSAGKDVQSCLSYLPRSAQLYVSAANVPRAMQANVLNEILMGMEFQSHTFQDLKTALKEALSSASDKDLILITGSVFTVAELLDQFPQDVLRTSTNLAV